MWFFFIVLISNLIVRYNVGRSQLQSTPEKSERVTIPIWHPFKVNKNQMVMKSNVFISSIVLKSTITWIGKLIWTSLNCVYELLSTDVSYILQWQYIQVLFLFRFRLKYFILFTWQKKNGVDSKAWRSLWISHIMVIRIFHFGFIVHLRWLKFFCWWCCCCCFGSMLIPSDRNVC